MSKREDLTLLISGVALASIALVAIALEPRSITGQASSTGQTSSENAVDKGFLTDPFLQLPTQTSVRVVWFTEFEGQGHTVIYGTQPGQSLETDTIRQVFATTRQLTRLKEDQDSVLPGGDGPEAPTFRPVWRHEAEVTGLIPGQRLPYQVRSQQENGTILTSGTFSLAAAPPAEQPLQILLTSDHQQMPMTAANIQKVAETIGQVDAVFLAGDLVNVPDRGSEWFDDADGGAFFPILQGRANYSLDKSGRPISYRGGALLQHAPLFPAIGNHEVMGRVSQVASLNDQFNDPVPRGAAAKLYQTNPEAFNPTGDEALRRQWVIENSYNTDTYEQIFTLPKSQVPNPDRPEETSRYYAVTFGDVRLISLFVTNIWRPPGIEPRVRGRFRERQRDLGNPAAWGHGQHIFEPIDPKRACDCFVPPWLGSPNWHSLCIRLQKFTLPV